MFRIDHPTRAASIPAPDPVGSPGYFVKPDPNTATPGTRVTQDWLNAVQEELANAVEGQGLTLDKGDRTQLLKALGKVGGGNVNLLLNPEGRFVQRGTTRRRGPRSPTRRRASRTGWRRRRRRRPSPTSDPGRRP